MHLQGLLWGLTCTKLIYGDKMKIPHVAGESFTNMTTGYQPIYSDHVPTELTILGIISFCLFLVNVGCIFITAMIVLKVSAKRQRRGLAWSCEPPSYVCG